MNHQDRSAKSYRSSRQRERLLALLRSTGIHPTASWLYDQLKKDFPSLSLGTVYRNLSILIEQGFVRKIDSGSTFDRFEAKTTPHYHLICNKCGKIIDFEQRFFPEINKEISRSTDFDIESHRIDFFGTCSDCRTIS
ncbi:MAG: transcriptional repressor [Chlorobiales bacterium]|nr:transcriptional repressor [Chlorobiales bacterium]